jgi:hypothetical protein
VTGKVSLPEADGQARPARRGRCTATRCTASNVITSIVLIEHDLERHNEHLLDKYARMTRAEQRFATYECDDADS